MMKTICMQGEITLIRQIMKVGEKKHELIIMSEWLVKDFMDWWKKWKRKLIKVVDFKIILFYFIFIFLFYVVVC